jgi:CcmD family protein
MTGNPFLIAGYLIFWMILFGYILYLALKIKTLDRKLSHLESVLAPSQAPRNDEK